jgi:aspartate aminotransferase-like enzyme
MYGRFFLPGPTEVRPEILAAMQEPMIGHRGKEMSALLEQADPMLRRIFGTVRPVYVSSSSATGLMEAAVRNGVRRRALALVNGAFSGRFRDLVRDCGREVVDYTVEWGEAHDPERVERMLREGGFDAVTVVHSETSTGVLNPLAGIAEAVRRAETATGDDILVLVDGVTSVGAADFRTDQWGLDFALTGSQKALALPPGLAFGCATARMLERAATLPGRGQYFDLLEFDKYWQKFQTPTTPALSLIYALLEQLRAIEHETVGARAERHLGMARRCWEWTLTAGARWDLSVLAPEGARSPTVTTIRLPAAVTGTEVAARMKRRGYVIGSGYGKLKDATFRIGHMGDHSLDSLNELLNVLEEALGE